jgi:hypothetical protein
MRLREHPLLSYRKIRSWPPAWVWIGGDRNTHPKGEVGSLKQVRFVDGPFVSRCFLWMEYEESMYLGCLRLSDRSFCEQLSKLLEKILVAPLSVPVAWISSFRLAA